LVPNDQFVVEVSNFTAIVNRAKVMKVCADCSKAFYFLRVLAQQI